MNRIALTQSVVRMLFDYHPDGYLIWRMDNGRNHAAGRRAGTPSRYCMIKICGVFYPAHRIIFLWHHGRLPEQIDHANRDKLDNRIENLRPATTRENAWNAKKRKDSTHRFKGLCRAGSGYMARISAHGQSHYLGWFRTEEEAARAWNEAARRHHGEFAALNTHL